MKFKKIGLCITVFIISLFISKTNINAYDIFTNKYGVVLNEERIYQEFSKIDGFDIKEYKNIYCTSINDNYNCYAYNDILAQRLSGISNASLIVLNKSELESCDYYNISFTKNNIDTNLTTNYYSCFSINSQFYSSSAYSNFNFPNFTDEQNKKYNVLDFSPYISGTEEKEELEITITGTEVLSSMLDKTKNIYEVLIANQLFVLCLSILLSYLVFIILYKMIKK